MQNPQSENYQSNILNIQILNRVRTIAIFAQIVLTFIAIQYLAIKTSQLTTGLILFMSPSIPPFIRW